MPRSRFATEPQFSEAFARVFGSAISADATTLDWMDSPVGPLLVGANDHALQLLAFTHAGELDRQLQRIRARHPVQKGTNAVTIVLRAQLAKYFAAQRRDFDVPLEYAGSGFQQRVWATLRQIPYGGPGPIWTLQCAWTMWGRLGPVGAIRGLD